MINRLKIIKPSILLLILSLFLFALPSCSAAQTVKIPILYYHNLTESEDEVGDYTITAETFRSHLEALTEAGYTTISFEELSAWVNGESGESLPDKPIIITFDD